MIGCAYLLSKGKKVEFEVTNVHVHGLIVTFDDIN